MHDFAGTVHFFPTGVSVHGKCIGVRVRVWTTSPNSAPISWVTLGKSLNFFELMSQGSQHPPIYLTELLWKSKWTSYMRVLHKRQDAGDISKDIQSSSKGGSEDRSLSFLFSKESSPRDTAEKQHLGVWPCKEVYGIQKQAKVSFVHHLYSHSPFTP